MTFWIRLLMTVMPISAASAGVIDVTEFFPGTSVCTPSQREIDPYLKFDAFISLTKRGPSRSRLTEIALNNLSCVVEQGPRLAGTILRMREEKARTILHFDAAGPIEHRIFFRMGQEDGPSYFGDIWYVNSISEKNRLLESGTSTDEFVTQYEIFSQPSSATHVIKISGPNSDNVLILVNKEGTYVLDVSDRRNIRKIPIRIPSA